MALVGVMVHVDTGNKKEHVRSSNSRHNIRNSTHDRSVLVQMCVRTYPFIRTHPYTSITYVVKPLNYFPDRSRTNARFDTIVPSPPPRESAKNVAKTGDLRHLHATNTYTHVARNTFRGMREDYVTHTPNLPTQDTFARLIFASPSFLK